MPFDDKLPSAPSDGHRMLWIEVNNNSILGKEVPHSSRNFDLAKLTSTNPRCQKSYGKSVQKGYSKNGMFQLHYKLQRSVKSHQKGKIKNISKFIQKFSKQRNFLESKTSDIKTTKSRKTRLVSKINKKVDGIG